MKQQIFYLNEIVEFHSNNNIPIGLEHFDLITNSLLKITQSLFDHKVQLDYHLRELEGKYFRFGYANISIIKLIKGNQFKLNNREFLIPDIFSYKSLTRMQIESFLIIYYLFYDDITIEEKAFRYDIYKIHSLQKQLGFKINIETANTKELRKKIKSELEQAINNVKASSFYNIANEKDRNNFL